MHDLTINICSEINEKNIRPKKKNVFQDDDSSSNIYNNEMENVVKELIDLYLSVKIRKNVEIDEYDSSMLENERKGL